MRIGGSTWRRGLAAMALAMLSACAQPGAPGPGARQTPGAPPGADAPAPADRAPTDRSPSEAAAIGPAEAAAPPRDPPSGNPPRAEMEAPDIFESTGLTLWDGLPSLGGIWAAHPLVERPTRVRIVNLDSGLQTEGALLRRDGRLGGPAIQISADAAAALEVGAGKVARIRIVALRDAPIRPDAAPSAAARPDGKTASAPRPDSNAPAAPKDFEAKIARAIDSAGETGAAPKSPGAPARPAPAAAMSPVSATPAAAMPAAAKPAAAKPAATPAPARPAAVKPAAEAPAPTAVTAAAPRDAGPPAKAAYLQVATFSNPDYADRAARGFADAGLATRIRRVWAGDRAMRELLLGPFDDPEAMSAALAQARAAGYADAFSVRR